MSDWTSPKSYRQTVLWLPAAHVIVISVLGLSEGVVAEVIFCGVAAAVVVVVVVVVVVIVVVVDDDV